MNRKPETTTNRAARPTFTTAPEDPLHLTALSFIEQLLIWSMRLWLRQGQAGASELKMLKDAWRLARAETLFVEFDSCMTLLSVTALPPLGSASLRHPMPTPDEIRVLAVLKAFQQGDADQAKRVLCARLPCAAVRIGGPAIETFSRSLADAGHRLPSRLWPLVEWDELGQLALESDRLSAISTH